MLMPNQRDMMVRERIDKLWTEAGEPEGMKAMFSDKANKEIDAEESFGADYKEVEAAAKKEAEAAAKKEASGEKADDAPKVEKEPLKVDPEPHGSHTTRTSTSSTSSTTRS